MQKAIPEDWNSIVHQLLLVLFREKSARLGNNQIRIQLDYPLKVRIATGLSYALLFQQDWGHIAVVGNGNYPI